ncbi:MAG: SGNH/GDSL hydrolase family protein [Hyphomicrobiales bacterium]
MKFTLLGDSIIDNGAYVAEHEPDVLEQVRLAIPKANVISAARDGSTVQDVHRGQLGSLDGADRLVLSAGGNNALWFISLFEDTTPVTATETLNQLYGIITDFRSSYSALLDKIFDRHIPALVMTVYNPRLELEWQSKEIQRAAECALCLFNDVIQREANARGFSILELRSLLNTPEDFANPIEPSAVGGDRIAKAIANWVSEK